MKMAGPMNNTPKKTESFLRQHWETALLMIWVFVPMFLYCYNHRYLFPLAIACFFIFPVIFVILLRKGPLYRFDFADIRKAIARLVNVRVIELNQADIIFVFVFLSWFLAITAKISGLAGNPEKLIGRPETIPNIIASLSLLIAILFLVRLCRRGLWKFTLGFAVILTATALLAYLPANPLSSIFVIDSSVIFSAISLWQRLIMAALYFVVLLAVTHIFGRQLLDRLGLAPDRSLATGLISITIGLIPFMLGTFFLALGGWLNAAAITVLALLILACSWPYLKKIYKQPVQTILTMEYDTPGRAWLAAIAILTLFFASLFFVTSYWPAPADADSLNTYFAAPMAYVGQGGYIPLGYYGHANMGQNVEMLYSIAILAGGPPLVMLHSWLAFFLIILSVFAIADRFFGRQHALIALATVLFIPINIYFIHTAKVDLWLALYLLHILLLLWLWLDTFDKKYLYLAGLFTGIAVGIKYTAIPFAAVLLASFAIAALARRRSQWRQTIISLAVAVVLALAAFSPWAIKNTVVFANPLYPQKIFGLPGATGGYLNDSGLPGYQRMRGEEVMQLKLDYPATGKNPLTILRALWHQSIGYRIFDVPSHDAGFLGLIVIIPLLFFVRKYRALMIILPAVIVALAAWQKVSFGGIWYLYPLLIILYLLASVLFVRFPSLARIYLPVMALVFITNITVYGNLPFLLRSETDNNALYRFVPFAKAAEDLNRRIADSGGKAIVVGDFRAAYIDNPQETVVNVDPYLGIAGYALRNGNDYYYELLKKNNIKYIVHSYMYTMFEYWPEIKGISLADYRRQYEGAGPSIYDDLDAFRKFLDTKTDLVYDDGIYMIYRIN